ncbi:methyltransferase domain-containing protein [Streptomyces sp. CB02400]|uniref:class I SAM-dependent methyltransferase n=1 Tax=Streptomyces sp. NPDC057238 TaxID=3346060 RepID=UPI001F1C199A
MVEPDPAMLTELRRSLPAVHALRGSAEAIPFPDASVDAVAAGNAMHWFDMVVAGPGIARVLVPGGVLAGLWNVMDDRTEWAAGLARVSGAAVGPRDTPTSRRAEPADAHLPRNGVAARFGSPEQAGFPHGQRRTAGSSVAILATRAGVLVMPEHEREATLGRFRAFLANRPECCASGGCGTPRRKTATEHVVRGTARGCVRFWTSRRGSPGSTARRRSPSVSGRAHAARPPRGGR